ncbi:FkbM family methyltransferase [Chlorogloeopsis sp. ULAP01]|uniref:FkbM family methyltransferase n=1 Tax=Chlorogloeopsis sp. ULAP01 TaxID=3056483 RepID=UPI0025AA5B4A|nr:FkbM family methyltransferase [Chlorogloeopsis sp. ULAP01]MDM9380821.1 FkbM family methyltransferase [Chlorogloeopsis sp. ULAP01]
MKGRIIGFLISLYEKLLRIYKKINRIHNFLLDVAEAEIQRKENQKSTYHCVYIQSQNQQFKMILNSPGFVEDTIIRRKTWEPYLSSVICFFMKEDGVFLDIGANIGYHSLYTAASFSNSQCICFEPHPKIYKQLVQNVLVNTALKNICCHNIAVGEQNGEITFYVQRDDSYNRGLSSLAYNYDLGENCDQIKVNIIQLDDFIDENLKSKISVIKIDTQGCEYQVFCGALDTINKSKPIIIFEFEPDYHSADSEGALKNILEKIPDYKILLIDRDLLAIREFEISEVCKHGFEGDFICLPKNDFDFYL